MKWILSQQSLDHHRWLLQNAAEQTQFTYSLLHGSIRIKSKTNRLFFLEIAGLFHKKVFLRSEYGVIVGESNWTTSKEGIMQMNEQKLIFCWNDSQLSFFNKNKTLLSSLEVDQPGILDKKEQFVLLFSSAWILFADASTKKSENLLVA